MVQRKARNKKTAVRKQFTPAQKTQRTTIQHFKMYENNSLSEFGQPSLAVISKRSQLFKS